MYNKLSTPLAAVVFTAFITVCSANNQNGSLWPDDSTRLNTSLYGDPVAGEVGDFITIVVNLSTTATKNQSTQTAKKTSVDDSITALGYPYTHGDWDWYRFRGQPPTFTWGANQSFAGSGQLNNQETLTTTIQARVTSVLPNGTMRIEAHRDFEAGKEKSTLVLTGFVRQTDLDSSNTISSSQIADLQIKQQGNGPLSSSQNKGWLTRLYEFISPF